MPGTFAPTPSVHESAHRPTHAMSRASREALTMDMTFTLTGGSRVEAQVGPFTIVTDQQPDAVGPTPFMLFLASIGACAAYYVQAFCRQRGIPVDGIRVLQRSDPGPSGLVERVHLSVELPPEFPERYHSAVLRAAEQCTVKKHLDRPPSIDIGALVLESSTIASPTL